MCSDTRQSKFRQLESGKQDLKTLSLRITEIFYSLQGESSTAGFPTVFIRLTGCPLRCVYCDTSYAFSGGEWMNIDKILQQVKEYSPRYITVTGGEPLAQNNCHQLLTRLCNEDYKVSLETSGAIDIAEVDSRVIKVVDLKTPDSGESEKNRYENIQYLDHQDQVKFVISSRQDYEWAQQMIEQYSLASCCEVLFSPVYEKLEPKQLADWILEDRLTVRFQIQLHKYLWEEGPGR